VHVVVNESRCIAAGQCVLNAPEIFDQREDDGIVVLLDDHPAAEYQDSARLAARLCPAEVIQFQED
jgi:ferredoxin